MLQIKNIVKTYLAGDSEVHALRGVNIDFREHEFVSILGPSGCGKTTLLNIIGGLDRYTEGDLVINGISTKLYKDADWDTYRNHSIGFVFQSYNLIPHQSVLSNVELALTLSGVSKSERRRRAKEALERVGLGDQLHKRPNQMSGGQMQRVAIARALVNNPDILLADEPTGALDTETSVQIMEILKSISKDKLIIMVTHNPVLAEQYSSRIINLLDGQVTGDSNPYHATAAEVAAQTPKKKAPKKPSMSFFAAMSLSMNNLLTKKARTFLTSFAGSIGIIGIALILALSNGIQNYINDIQRQTLASYPITIQKESTDLSAMISSIMGVQDQSGVEHEEGKVYSSSVMYDLMHSFSNAGKEQNNLSLFKKELIDNYENNDLAGHVSSIQYHYDVNLNIYVKDKNGDYACSDINEMFEKLYNTSGMNSMMEGMSSSFSNMTVWSEILPENHGGNEGTTDYVSGLVREQYELVHGTWPSAYDEVVLVMTKNNEISDITLYSLGLMTTDEMESLMMSALMNKDYESKVQSWTYEDICNIRFRLLLNTDYYKRNAETGTYDSIRDNAELLEMAIRNAPELKIVGIVRPAPDSTASMISGSLAYTSALTDYIIQKTAESEIVQEQIKDANKNRDLLTGLPFVVEEDLSNAQKVSVINAYLKSLSSDKKAEIYMDYMCTPSEDYLNATVSEYMKQIGDRAALEDAIAKQYAEKMGVSENTVREYLASYTDEELNKMVETALREMITQQYASQKKEEIRKAASKPDEETLQQAVDYYRQMVLAQCGNDKSAYLVYYFKTDMELDDAQSAAMVAGMSAEDVERIFEKITAEQAQALLESQFAITEEQINNNIADMLDAMVADADEETTLVLYEKYAPSRASDSTYENNLKLLGVVNPDEPSGISIYATTFEDKDAIADIIENYNETKDKEDQISYTDYVALIMSSVTTIINVISYVLIAFVSISLVVSSIMIGIITYISVLERTKEIGVLRSIGASKRDVSRVFNAETMIIGLCAGLIGIAVTVLLCIPISAVVQSLSGIPTIYASLPLAGGVILVAISVALTLIAGLIPSRIAAKKDPVEALRSE